MTVLSWCTGSNSYSWLFGYSFLGGIAAGVEEEPWDSHNHRVLVGATRFRVVLQ
jgi:hypothetical protein